jgi:hypothetical protein
VQSITHQAVKHTAAAPRPAPTGAGHHPFTIHLGTVHLPLTWGLVGLVGAVALCFLADRAGKAKPADAKKADKALWAAVKALAAAVWALARLAGRFLGGRPLWGQPKSDATWWKAGTLAKPAVPITELRADAIAPAAVTLAKPEPRRWVRTLLARLDRYAQRVALVRAALHRTVRAAQAVARHTGRAWRLARRIHAAVWPVLATLGRALAAWPRWPYAARSAARLALLAAVVGLTVPAWRGWTVLGLVLVAAGLVAAGIRYQPKPPGDDQLYGPALWALLREDLHLPEEELMENWLHIPPALALPDAAIVVRLPWTFRETGREQLSALVNARVPGEWVPKWTQKGHDHFAVWTHKPPTPPKPECPDEVGFFDPDIQAAIAACKKGEVVIGKDENGRIIVKQLDGETPHWALSVGSGGGKSTFCHMVIAQLIRQGYHIFAADVKRISVDIFIGVPGVYVYNDPMAPQDMRAGIEWFTEEIAARNAIVEADRTAEFPGLLCLIEEANEFADISREWWDDNRKTKADEFGPAERAADPIWGEVASGARLGRAVNGNILAVFQDLRDQVLGGKGLRNLFRLKFMGNFTVNQWKNVIGTTPVPDSYDKAGRMMIVEGNSQYWVQTIWAKPELLRAWAIEQRQATGFDPSAGLFGAPPKPSPKRLPRLLQGLSRDKLPEALLSALEDGPGDETAGRLSHEGTGVTPSGAAVTAPRDRLRLIPGQAGHQPQDAAPDPTAPPELLPLAEIARRLDCEPGIPSYDTMRAHKSRRDDFPEGVGISGKELYTESQIRAYYQAERKNA